MKYLLLLLTVSFLLQLTSCFQPTVPAEGEVYEMPKQSISKDGMIVSAHPLASQVGVEILQKGGNAIDAMVAVQYALAVTYPRAGNIGGGGFMVYRTKDGEAHTLDFREKAPGTAHRNMYLDSDSNAIDSLSIYGHLAVGVPGVTAGMYAAHQKFGKLSWANLIAPSVQLAEEGIKVTEREANSYNEYQKESAQYNPHPNPFVRPEKWEKGQLLVQKDLAEVLRAIQNEGKEGFYEGKVAELLVNEIKKGGGIISLDDLKNYEEVWRQPITFPYKNYRIIAMPPPSSGGLCLAELMNMVEDYPMEEWGFKSAKSIHLMTEAARRAYADRAEHLGDIDFYPVPVAQLASQEYVRMRMADFVDSVASVSDSITHGNPLAGESDETTHYSIVDKDDNAISVTTTINSNYGSKVIVEGGGFFLNNEMDDFSAKPGSPNQFGLLGNEAIAIAPNKRMLSSMTPTIAEKDGKLFMVVGTPGGSKIITTVFQVITNVIDFDLSLLDAVHQPRFHFQWLPDALWHEKDAFSPELIQELEALGHSPRPRDYIGQVEAILIRADGTTEGVADRRGDDTALGADAKILQDTPN